MSSTKTAALYSRLKGDGVFAKEKEELQDVSTHLCADVKWVRCCCARVRGGSILLVERLRARG